MHSKPVALVTGANKGIGLQISKDLEAHGFTVLVGLRNFEKGKRQQLALGKMYGPSNLMLPISILSRPQQNVSVIS
ncbi:SDR family NAD(P)-dependent oxidoreductase [Neobacillus endophyticus]|uniref:SDR family NAD(P)-dependent oxidoreductase n=1 Tax=Neobacillus endophyticus TaxID=2738405 RepID=UPI0024840796|nr:SDR family NAD(P)-dependent oxidoreductase [Neobacillus endophyticus]